MIEVIIKADSQEEFDRKRHEIIKALGGTTIKTSRKPRLKAQRQLHAQADAVFKSHMDAAKAEVEEMLAIMLPEDGGVAPIKIENL